LTNETLPDAKNSNNKTDSLEGEPTMNAFMHFLENAFNPVVFVFAVSNLGTMGLQVRIGEAAGKLRDVRFLVLFFFWGWVVGPALGFLITKIIPLDTPYAAVMLMTSLAPCAPFLPQMIDRARGDVPFAGAFIPLATVGTVILMPLLAPLLINGVSVSSWALAKPLIISVLAPLIVGTFIRTYASKVADKIFNPVKLIAGLSTLLTMVIALLVFGKSMLNTAGSYALLSMTVFGLLLGFLAYRFGFGLKQSQRSVMGLGMGTRNITAALLGVYAIPNPDPRMLAMVILWTLSTIILARIISPFLGKLADKTADGGETVSNPPVAAVK
jgi:bile acid:Na+ symporter, BASS family